MGNADGDTLVVAQLPRTNVSKPYGNTTDSESRILKADSDIHVSWSERTAPPLNWYHPYVLCVDNNDNRFVCEFYKYNLKKMNIYSRH